MKTSLSLSTAALSIALFFSSAFAEGAKSIIDRFESQKAEALEAYLESNPEAEDVSIAESVLVGSYLQLGMDEKAAPLLQERYDNFPKELGADIQELFSGIIEPLFGVYKGMGDKDAARSLINTAQKDLALHPASRQLSQVFGMMLSRLEMPGVGDTLDIKFTSIDGREVDLASMKGKVILIDFWATWCGPCIAEMPSIVGAYEKYKDAGFEVVGISLDQDKAALERFVSDSNMAWPQHFDGRGMENEFARKYSITSIPAMFLVGPDGKIAVSDLRGHEIDEAVAGLLE